MRLRMSSRRYLTLVIAAAGLSMPVASAPLRAQTEWEPFKERDQGPSRRYFRKNATPEPALPPPLAPMDGPSQPRRDPSQSAGNQPGLERGAPWAAPAGRVEMQPLPSGPLGKTQAIERADLAPIIAADASGLPADLWQGLDLKALEQLMTPLSLPPKSAALHSLWRRMLVSAATPPAGGEGANHGLALKLEALYRSGLMTEMAEVETAAQGASTDSIIAALSLRRRIAMGDTSEGCAAVKHLSQARATLPGRLKSELNLYAGYCAGAAQNPGAAGLAAELAREDGLDAPFALEILDGIATQSKPKLSIPARVTALEYRMINLLGPSDPSQIFDKAEPALLTAVALDANAPSAARVAAAEAAARGFAIPPAKLAEIYAATDTANAAGDLTSTPARRAALFKVVSGNGRADQRFQAAQALLDDARRAGLGWPVAQAMAPILKQLASDPEAARHGELIVETALAAGQFADARRMAEAAPALNPWLGLIDIADARAGGQRDRALQALEDIAVRGRFKPEALHRLATVLDALDYNIPIPLWEAASRTPQPATGHLPETGVLANLADAAKKKDVARTILLTMRTIGPGGPEQAHMIALGDAIRALKRAGLDADARALGLEALYAVWPRANPARG